MNKANNIQQDKFQWNLKSYREKRGHDTLKRQEPSINYYLCIVCDSQWRAWWDASHSPTGCNEWKTDSSDVRETTYGMQLTSDPLHVHAPAPAQTINQTGSRWLYEGEIMCSSHLCSWAVVFFKIPERLPINVRYLGCWSLGGNILKKLTRI